MTAAESPFGDLLQDYIVECLPLAEQVGDAFVELERRWQSGEPGDDLLTTVKGRLHTIKGNSAMMGIAPARDVAHALEDACGFLGRAADAEESFRKALAVNPDDPLAQINLGDELLTQKKYQEAVDAYRKAIKVNPDLPNAYYSLAIAFAEAGLYRDAARSWRKCAERAQAAGTPGNKETADRALENAKLMDEIISDAEKALKERETKKKELEGAQKRAAAGAGAAPAASAPAAANEPPAPLTAPNDESSPH